MKLLLIIFLSIFVSLSFSSISEAQKIQAEKQKDNPCITDCNNEHKKCIDATKKDKKAERKGKLSECNKAQKDCKLNCDKAK